MNGNEIIKDKTECNKLHLQCYFEFLNFDMGEMKKIK